MSTINNLASHIPTAYKSNIPFYNILKTYDFFLKFFIKNQMTIKSFATDKRYIPYEKEILKFFNIHKGQRCFIIATGPSLQKTNVKLLKDEIIFGVNTLFKGLPKLGIKCNYYCVSDPDMFNLYHKDILGLGTTLFLGSLAGKIYLSKKEEFRKYQKNEPILIRSLGRLLYLGWKKKDITVGTYSCHLIPAAMCLPIAYYMGFKEVYLIGCDCDYLGKKHHFNGENYSFQSIASQKSQRYWSETFKEFEILKNCFENDEREIYNATVGGKLEVFERKTMEEIFELEGNEKFIKGIIEPTK